MEVRTPQEANLEEMRGKLTKLNIGEVTLQEFGSKNDVLIRIPSSGENNQDVSIEKVKSTLGDNLDYRKVEKIGPKVGSELVQHATIAVIISLMAILLYVWIRFEWQFAVCGVVALAHDCLC